MSVDLLVVTTHILWSTETKKYPYLAWPFLLFKRLMITWIKIPVASFQILVVHYRPQQQEDMWFVRNWDSRSGGTASVILNVGRTQRSSAWTEIQILCHLPIQGRTAPDSVETVGLFDCDSIIYSREEEGSSATSCQDHQSSTCIASMNVSKLQVWGDTEAGELGKNESTCMCISRI